MSPLPTPPPAYWATIPWWAYIGFLTVALVVSVIVGPWMVQRARGAPRAMVSREAAVTGREAAAWKRADEPLIEVRADAERGWDLARGWAARSHLIWHEQVNAVQRANDARRILLRVLDNKLSLEAAREIVAGWQDMPPPPVLPDVDAVEPKKPGETKYA